MKIANYLLDVDAKKKVNGAIMVETIKKLAKDVKRATGRTSKQFTLWMDRASAHTALITQEMAKKHFAEVILQPGKSPDMNMLDAGVFPTMERRVERLAAGTKSEIDDAVSVVWNGLSSETLQGTAAKVRSNMRRVLELDGGNFYSE